MPRPDGDLMEPDVREALEAIDATLAGDPVDPQFADVAEMALLLRADRPQASREFDALLDERVRVRFAPSRAARASRLPRRGWLWAPAAGLAAAVLVAVVIVAAGGSSPRSSSSGRGGLPVPAAGVPRRTSSAAGAINAAASSAGTVKVASPAAAKVNQRTLHSATALSTPTLGPNVQAAVVPPSNGRKITQSAQLALTAVASRIDQVSQEVFDVAGRVGAVVRNSNVTAGGPGGYAQFQLSVPSGSLGQAMSLLSTLPYAHVASRTDSTQDVNDQYQADVRALGDARALRTSLLKQLASATTTVQIDSLTARIHDAEASISSDEATLRGLNHQIDFSQVNVTVNAGTLPVPVKHGSTGFTVSKAAHDAGRVLTVAAGVALIAAAAMVPIGLLGALVWWGAATLRRRRREHALDLA